MNHSSLSRRRKTASGAVTMEYVLLCVLVAGASIMMVLAFSRAVMRQMALLSYVMAPMENEDFSEIQQRFRDDTENDKIVGSTYSDYMHGERVNKE
ncbi:MAG: hypothetical protein IJS14_09775 [Lentisphaeria bacterium]|nr:hypothetical protein [Lentisphaeria bacterium]